MCIFLIFEITVLVYMQVIYFDSQKQDEGESDQENCF